MQLPNVDEMQFVNQANIKHSVNALVGTLATQPINQMDVSVLNVSAVKIAARINIVIHKLINAKVSKFYIHYNHD